MGTGRRRNRARMGVTASNVVADDEPRDKVIRRDARYGFLPYRHRISPHSRFSNAGPLMCMPQQSMLVVLPREIRLVAEQPGVARHTALLHLGQRQADEVQD